MNDQIVPNKALRDALMEHVSIDVQTAAVPNFNLNDGVFRIGRAIQITVRLLWDQETVISESPPVEIDLGRG